jgi:6-phosphogluconate dehydrogenase
MTGEDLELNIERAGFTVAIFNRPVENVDLLFAGRRKGKGFIVAHLIEKLEASLKLPRKVTVVKAGQPVDDAIELIFSHFVKGDIIIVVCSVTRWRTESSESLG